MDHTGKKVVVVGACTSAHDIATDYYNNDIGKADALGLSHCADAQSDRCDHVPTQFYLHHVDGEGVANVVRKYVYVDS